MSRIGTEPVVLVGAARDGYRSRLNSDELTSVSLSPLTDAQATQLLADHAPQLRPTAHADRAARLSNISGRRRRAAGEDEKHSPESCHVSINRQHEYRAVVVPTVDRCARVRRFGQFAATANCVSSTILLRSSSANAALVKRRSSHR